MASSIWIGWFGGGTPVSYDGSTTTITGNWAVTGQFYAPVSATVPGYSFTGDTNTGYGASAADTLALFAGGTTPRVTLTATVLNSTVPIDLPNAVFLRGTATNAALQNLIGLSSSNLVSIDSSGNGVIFGNFLRPGSGGYQVAANVVAIFPTAPTIASGFGTSPSVVASNGTAAFQINVGTGGTASSGVITMPAATTAWNGSVENRTAVAANRGDQRTVITASTTTSITVQNQTISTGAALAWTASDVLHFVTTAD